MPILADLSHWWGEDLDVTPTGDIAIVTTTERTVQRVIRRLMTAPTDADQSDYPFEPSYGVGLGERVGEDLDARAIAALVRSQILLERSVARTPEPVIDVRQLDTGVVVINITYTDLAGEPQNFTFNLGERADPSTLPPAGLK